MSGFWALVGMIIGACLLVMIIGALFHVGWNWVG
jgi:hypothetical protein